jgi:hypothetical protein
MANRDQENGNHNFAFQAIDGFRNRGLKNAGDEDFENMDTSWAEISSKIEEQNITKRLPVYAHGSNQLGTRIFSKLPTQTFWQQVLYAATKLANKAELKLKTHKIKVTKALGIGNLQVDIKLSEEPGPEGQRVAEFIKTSGPIMEFYQWTKEVQKKVEELSM